MSVLGIDVGTTTCKGIVVDKNGFIIAKKQTDYSIKPIIKNNTVTIDAKVFKECVFLIIKELSLMVNGVDVIKAISISTHGETLIVVGKDGEPLTPAILSMDRRCICEMQFLEKELGKEKFYSICGTPIHSQYPVPKIMWHKKNEPEIFSKAYKFCTVQDYLHSNLGVGYYVDYSLASRFGGFDIKKRDWSNEILSIVGVNKDRFSIPVQAGSVIGVVDKEIAYSLGLDGDVKVVAGGHDQPCAALAMGAENKKITISAGSYECVTISTDTPLNDPKGYLCGLNSYCHVLENKYVTLAFFSSGLMVNWFIDKLCPYLKDSGKNIYNYLESIAPKTPTSICFTPHLYGAMNPKWDDNARAVVTGLSGEMGLGDLYRAVLEGTACELSLNLKVLEELAGEVDKVVLCGGGTRSDLWMQIRADVLNKKLMRIDGDIDASCIGAALIAGVGVRMFSSYQQAIDKIKYKYSEFLPKNPNGYIEQKEKYLKIIERN